jgi:ATP-dependent helicase HrpA
LRDLHRRRRGCIPRITYPEVLPITAKREEIIAAIRRHPVIVVTGETGSGKTTQIPKMCLEAGRGVRGVIGHTQPRRIAAVAAARRLAEELVEPLGRSVGYKIRFDERTGPDVCVKVMTDGILLAEIQSDPFLKRYDTIIVDEAHERSLNIDFILGILRNLLKKRRDLKVVITSATIDTEKFSHAFDDAPVIEVSGRLYPVEVRYAPVDPELEEGGDWTYVDAAVQAAVELKNDDAGDVLIFMPTEADIREACDLLKAKGDGDDVVLPLFSGLPGKSSGASSSPPRRKVIVATNVAETSVTIPASATSSTRALHASPVTTRAPALSTSPYAPVSRAARTQRKGRCGRGAERCSASPVSPKKTTNRDPSHHPLKSCAPTWRRSS